MFKKFLPVIVAIFFLSSCGPSLNEIQKKALAPLPKPTEKQLNAADYGAYPTNYKELIKNYVQYILKDPYSAVYAKWKEPEKSWTYNEDFSKFIFCYLVEVDINAKNSYGAYTGYSTFLFYIKNNTIITYLKL